jgi:hypothetical protein
LIVEVFLNQALASALLSVVSVFVKIQVNKPWTDQAPSFSGTLKLILNDRSFSNLKRKNFTMLVIEGRLQKAEIEELKNKDKNLS